jgi:Tfp pilus assembly PilM family ATPase
MKPNNETNAMNKLLATIRGDEDSPPQDVSTATTTEESRDSLPKRILSAASDMLSRIDISRKLRIGVDIGSHSAKFVIVEMTRGGGILKAYWTREKKSLEEADLIYELTTELRKNLKAIAKGWSYKNIPVYLSISGRNLIMKKLSLPKMPAKEMKNAMTLKLTKEIESSPENVVFGYRINSPSSETQQIKCEVTVAAMNAAYLDEKIRSFEAAGFHDIRPLPVPMVISEQISSRASCVILDIGLDRTGIYVLSENVPFLYREVNIGGASFTEVLTGQFSYSGGVLELDREKAEELKRKYGISHDKVKEDTNADEALSNVPGILIAAVDKFSNEVKRTLDYAASSANLVPQKVILAGAGSSMPGLREHLEKGLGINVKYAGIEDFEWEVNTAENFVDSLHVTIFPVLAAMWAGKKELLIPEAYRMRKLIYTERKVFRYAAIIITGFILAYSTFTSDVATGLKGNTLLLDSPTIMNSELGISAQNLDRELKELDSWKRALSVDLPEGPDIEILLKEISHIIPDYIVLTELDMIPESDERFKNAPQTSGDADFQQKGDNTKGFVLLMKGQVVAEPLLLEAYLYKFKLILNESVLFDGTRILSWNRMEGKKGDRLLFSASCELSSLLEGV